MARNRKKKKFRRRRRLGFLYLVLSVVVVVVAVVLGSTLFFQVEDIQVTGNVKYSREEILDRAAVNENANLLLISEQAVSKRLKEALSYVDTVELHRKFPTTLELVITECQPAAVILTDGNWWILDSHGKILDQVDESEAGQYMQVTGPALVDPQVGQPAQMDQERAAQLKSLVGLLEAISEQGMLGKVTWLDLSASTEVSMGYEGRFTVKVLMSADYSMKMRVLAKIIDTLEPDDQGIIDIRNSRGRFYGS